ncbi:MAG TPA: hypothetical protein VK742_20385 [Candidatus Sulfotelmatobacter sp.]|jgi:hypothetical protein|nr:hypothetical protein [Candidatus Sulfotelmatobacter sp.]
MTTFDEWMLGLGITGTFCTVGAMIIAVIALNKKTLTQISPQPLTVRLIEEMHDQFANKKAFDDLVKHNTERHGQIFAEIRRVEKERREDVDARFLQLGESRNDTMEKLNQQFLYIRENLAAINREMQIRK